jgi:hypothetical protein
MSEFNAKEAYELVVDKAGMIDWVLSVSDQLSKESDRRAAAISMGRHATLMSNEEWDALAKEYTDWTMQEQSLTAFCFSLFKP